LNRRNISFVNPVKYLGVIFDKKITWRLHIKIIEAKAVVQELNATQLGQGVEELRSVVMVCGQPKQDIQLVSKACAMASAVMSGMGMTSGQRVKQ
jgi:hypothetical protein